MNGQSRKQASQLTTGDRVLLTIDLAGEVVSSESGEDFVLLTIKPVPCGGTGCPDECNCQFATFGSLDGPCRVRLKASQRPTYLGNLKELLAVLQQTEKQIGKLNGNIAHVTSEFPSTENSEDRDER